MRIMAKSDIGRSREMNQDSYYVSDLEKDEFHAILIKMLKGGKCKEVEKILNQRSVIERNGDVEHIAAGDIGRQFRWLWREQASHFIILLGTNRIVLVFLEREVTLVHPDAVKHRQTVVRIVDGTDVLTDHFVRHHGFSSTYQKLVGICLAPSLCHRWITVIHHPLLFRVVEIHRM